MTSHIRVLITFLDSFAVPFMQPINRIVTIWTTPSPFRGWHHLHMDVPLYNWMWKLPTTSCHFCSFLKLWAHLTWLRESWISSLTSGEEPERAADGARPGLRPGPGEHQRPRHRRQQWRGRLQLICTEVIRLQVHQLQGPFKFDVKGKETRERGNLTVACGIWAF